MKSGIASLSLRLFFVILLCAFASSAYAQYSFDALRLATLYPGQDPYNMSLGSSSAASYQGLGSVMVNPAVAGMADRSMVTFGFGVRDVSQTTLYPGLESMVLDERRPHHAVQQNFDDQQTGITHAGFIYKVPTVIGSLAIGGGYHQTAVYNSAYKIDFFNQHSSRTYQFLTEYQDLFDLAFDTFTIDNVYGEYESIFDFGGFMGVGQYAEVTQRGQAGEYNLFLSTEFQEDFFVGISVGVPVSNSSYEYFFIEESPLDNNGNPIYSGEAFTGSYNIDQVLFEEKVNVDAIGINARIGLLYTGFSLFDIGVSYTTRTRWNVDETFDVFLQTRFWDVVTYDGDVIVDDQDRTFGPVINDSFRGEYSYSLNTPSRFYVGASTDALPFMNLSFTAERVDYSRIKLRDFDTVDREIEISENNFISNNFKDVWNFRAGAAITVFDWMEPRLGWAWVRNPINYLEDNERHFFSAGLGIG
ncbi:hypothetical protein QLX67_12510, partial [Balneolaceae bacterium ANBcel3]|nr:hypothetical protein [Balneolaceae bacterium ANBcel3]